MDTNEINWDELKKKVDADLQKQINEEINNINSIEIKEKDKGILNIEYRLTPKEKFENAFDELWKEQEEETEEETEEDTDYFDEGGEIPDIGNSLDSSNKQINRIVWNNGQLPIRNPFWGPAPDEMKKINEELRQLQIRLGDCAPCKNIKKRILECKHISDDKIVNDDTYIYPLGSEQELYLCNECNKILASKLLEQLALELELDRNVY